jgi:HNH endonuclease
MNTYGTCACGCGAKTNTSPAGVPRRYRRGHNRRTVGSKGWMEGGYRYISVNGRKIAEHRHFVEQREGRELASNEVVHHVDGDKLNNAPDNLVVLTKGEHTRLHAKRPRSRWTPDEKLRARTLHAAGMTILEVARVLGRPFSSTTRYACPSAI